MQRFDRLAAAVCLAVLLGSVTTVAGCARKAPTTAADPVTRGEAATATSAPSVTATMPMPSGEESTRAASWTYGSVADYDDMFVRITDTEPVRKTYGIDVTFPEVAAGGKLAGVWMQVPDVDGGHAWALYDTSFVDVNIWIAPTVEEASPGRAYDGSTPPGTVSGGVNGYPAIMVPRVWVPPGPNRSVGGPAYLPGGWRAASVSWAQGQLVITVSSRERDVEDLLEVARSVEITGTARMPMPKKFRKK